MNFTLKILSPLHIGCGETYTGLNYIVDGNTLYYLEPDAVFSVLGAYCDNYVKWLEQESTKITELNSMKRTADPKDKKELNRKLNGFKRSFGLKDFIEKNRIPLNLNLFKQKSVYKIPLNANIQGSEDIQKFISQMHRIYIPGTEIKGAIRTAILYYFLKQDQTIYKWLVNQIQKFGEWNKRDIDYVKNQKKPNNRAKKKLNDQLEKIGEQLEQNILYAPNQKDAKFDLLKYLFISDSEIKKTENTICIAYAEPFNTRNFFKTYSEYCIPGIDFIFTDMTLENNLTKNEKLGFSINQKKYISDISGIMKSCHDFSNDLLEEEITYFSGHERSDVVNHLIQIQNLNEPDSPVIRIGKDEGFFSLTMGMLIKKRNSELYENVLIHATKGKSYDSQHGGPLPKTRKIVRYDRKSLTSGWCKLQFGKTDAGNPKTTLPKTKSSETKGRFVQPSHDSLKALQNKWRSQ